MHDTLGPLQLCQRQGSQQDILEIPVSGPRIIFSEALRGALAEPILFDRTLSTREPLELYSFAAPRRSNNRVSVNSHLMTIRNTVLLLLMTFLSLGCDPHLDSVYLGRAEAQILADVSAGDIAAVELYLDMGGNVNLQDEPGMTPLHHAANSGRKGSHLKMAELLIDRGAEVNATDDTHHTPLHLASMAANMEIAELLIDAGADVNARTRRSGETALFPATHGAAQGGTRTYLNLIKFLIARGADVNVKLKSDGETALHQASRSYSEKHASEVCALLIANGAHVNERNAKGHTALDEALANGRNKTSEVLRNHDAKTSNQLKTEEG